MNCPRCGAKMSGGVCSECGFPMNRKKKVSKSIVGIYSRIR